MGRRAQGQLVLTEAEREELVALRLRRKTAQALALRARIVLACAEGQANKVVAARQRVTQQTVGKWRARYIEQRLDGLLDAPRSGAPRTIDDARVDAVIAKTLDSVPAGATRWSTRSMARDMGLTQTAVSRIWRAFGLQPHRQDTFKLSSDPMFVDKVRDIVGLYLDPPLKAMVLCVDDKSQIQALDCRRRSNIEPVAQFSVGGNSHALCLAAPRSGRHVDAARHARGLRSLQPAATSGLCGQSACTFAGGQGAAGHRRAGRSQPGEPQRQT